ncbi:hypothetical protein GGX14DRAFT_634029 [Mycena pura]|uniref:F-box domain-containing protein n=1 Tax=Mycena pura TaxID=153505 RepID=A0AAD6VBM2_9AGAR|nr:hypothetical protein GGX14DRAFT_634029 [Mycena pura]
MAILCENCGHDPTADQRAALSKLNAELAQFKTHIPALEQKRQAIIDRLNAVVYPVLTLPPEITSRIFVHCLPHHGRVRPSPRSAPLVLTQICGRWRAIALSTGELWTSLDVTANVLRPGRDDLLKTWFSRAKRYPLSWTIRRPGFKQLHNGASAHIADIIPKVHRLEVIMPEEGFRRIMPLDTFLPLLQCLAAPLSSESLQAVLRCAPLLRELTIWESGLSFIVASKTLRRLELAGGVLHPIPVFLGILENCPLLSHLKIAVDVSLDPNPSPIAFSNIRSLDLVCGAWALKFVTLPNLTHLEYEDLTTDILQAFLFRSSCIIKSLSCSIPSTPEGVKARLGMFPWVETLELRLTISGGVHMLGEAISCLDPDVTSLVPQLRHITIQSRSPKNIDFLQIIDFLKCRPELRSFRLIRENPSDDRWRPRRTAAAEFEALRLLGVHFSIHFWKPSHRSPNDSYNNKESTEVWPKNAMDPC